MSSASTKHYRPKCRTSKGNGGLTPTRSSSGLGKMAAGTASATSTASLLPSMEDPMALLQTDTPGCPPKAGLSFLETTAPLSDSKGMDQEEAQKERCGENTCSVELGNQCRPVTSASVVPEVQPIELDTSVDEEIVDLTSESSIIDLTCNDSVVYVEESRQGQNQELRNHSFSDSWILCSDDNSECRETNHIDKWSKELGKEKFGSLGASGTVSCPICMDGYADIIYSGRLIMSTKCGHIFCSQCLHESLRSANVCPTCRKKLNHKQCHPIYI